MRKFLIFLVLAVSSFGLIIPTARTIDWSTAGVIGGIPTRSTIYTTISTAGGNDSTDNRATINSALATCPSGQVVYIPPGIYRVNGSINFPSNVTLRGSGTYVVSSTSLTIGTGAQTLTVASSLGYVSGVGVRLWRKADPGMFMEGTVTSYSGTTLVLNITTKAGSGTYTDWRSSLTMIRQVGSGANGTYTFGTSGTQGTSYTGPTGYSTSITAGATLGSTSITVASTTNIVVGTKLVITETNDASYVSIISTASGSPGATWVTGWNDSGARSRGQIVDVTAVNTGTKVVTLREGLYTAYTNTPLATYFQVQAQNSGVENILTFATNSGMSWNVYMTSCQNCWVYNCYFDFTDGTSVGGHVGFEWAYHNTIQKNWFRDAYVHSSGNNDSMVGFRYKATANLVTDNILERLHSSVIAEWGAAGNVISYNYATGAYDNSAATSPRFLPIDFDANHGAHPQFQLFEGNNIEKAVSDSYWGTAGPDTWARNWTHGAGTCTGPFSKRMEDYNAATAYAVGAGIYYSGTAYFANTATTAGQNPSTTPAKWTVIATITLNQDTAAMQLWEEQWSANVVGNILGDSTMTTATYKIINPTVRNYGGKYIWNLGYASSGDVGGTALYYNPSATYIDHGNYDYKNAAQTWGTGPVVNPADHVIPDSYYLAGKPAWFGNLTWPTYDPANAAAAAISSIPAGYRYLNDADPPTGDTTPPTPNPSTISGTPSHTTTTITVTATVSTDATSPPVAYNCSLGGVWQGWQASNVFTFTGLTPNTLYVVAVQAQDSVGNQTTASGNTNVTTDALPAEVAGSVLRNPTAGPL